MIRIIAFFILYVFSTIISFAQVKSEEILIKNDSIELPGTLSFTNTKTPLIIWVHGSGNVDRNGNQGTAVKANYIKQFRNEINKNNIAFFSYDKRTATKRNFPFLKNMKFNGFVTDLKTVINHFKNDHRFSEIILIGHSQGSLVAMLASKNIDKYISLAGAGEPINKIIVKQITAQNANLGEYAAKHFKELKETGSIKTVNPFLISIFSKPNLAFLKSWTAINPSVEIKKLTIPILIINGTKDLQVKIEDAKALHTANPKSEMVLIKNMNHVLKNIEKEADNMSSYYSADFALSKKLIKTVVTFVKK